METHSFDPLKYTVKILDSERDTCKGLVANILCTCGIRALGRLSQKDSEFKTLLDYIIRPSLYKPIK